MMSKYFGKLRRKDQEFNASLSYTWRPVLENQRWGHSEVGEDLSNMCKALVPFLALHRSYSLLGGESKEFLTGLGLAKQARLVG